MHDNEYKNHWIHEDEYINQWIHNNEIIAMNAWGWMKGSEVW